MSAWEQGLTADTRACERCGAVFAPQREHARFCGVGCRAAWNREHFGDPAVEASALHWSVTAISEANARLRDTGVRDRAAALTAVGEAVWWVTMVDATLVRHHREVYDAVIMARGPAEWRLTDATLAGLRFVRNWIAREAGLDKLIRSDGAGAVNGSISGWAWKPVPKPALGFLPPRGRTWELARYRAYRAHLAGHTIADTFGRAVTFLTLTGADAASFATRNAAGTRR
jgi:hypothetical protein